MAVYDKSGGTLHGKIGETLEEESKQGWGLTGGGSLCAFQGSGMVTGRGFGHVDSTAFRLLAVLFEVSSLWSPSYWKEDLSCCGP